MRRASNTLKWLVVTTALLALSSCTFFDSFVPKKGEETDVLDRQKNLTINDFRKLNEIDKEAKADGEIKTSVQLGGLAAPPLPDLAQVLAAPRAPKVANTKLVSLAVTEDVPLRDVLFELGRLAKVDIEVGSGLDQNGINLRATDQPFNEVIERIADLGGLRYSVKGNSIRVERDLPYIKNYSLDFLNLVRSSTSSYNLSTNILSAGGGGGAGGGGAGGGGAGGGGGGGAAGGGGGGGIGTSGSSNSITSTAESDLWSSLEASVNEILSNSADGAAGSGAAGAATASASTGAAAPAARSASGAAGAGGAAAGAGAAGGLVINRQAGVLSVNATERQHEMIKRFLSLMSRNSSAQVLIEAKIVEVALTDQFLSGINWTKLIGSVGGNRLSIGNYQPAALNTLSLTPAASLGNVAGGASNAITFGLEGGDLDAVLALTQRFGTTRTLSSPRLSAINNQQAVLTFARNVVFFNCTATPPVTTTTTGGGFASAGSNPTVDCRQSTVPIGIILSILPSINLDTQEITLSVRPTLTRQVDTAVNPQTGYIRALIASAPGGATSGITIPDITVPVIEVRELDSVMKVRSGGVMVIGGLMEDATRNESTGVPGAQEIPLLGNFFKSRTEDSRKSELIVFIKATIVNPDGSANAVDRAVYHKYVTDPRPIFPKQ